MSHNALPDLSSCSEEASSLGLTVHSEFGPELVPEQTRCLRTKAFSLLTIFKPFKCFQIAQHCRDTDKASAHVCRN